MFFFSKVWLRLGLAQFWGISYDSGPLVPGSPGPLVPWFFGPVVPWSPVLWSSGPRSPGPLVPWSSGPLVLWFLVLRSHNPGPLVAWSSGLSILWSLVAAFGRIEILPITAYGASEKIGLQKNNDICGFESLRLLRSQETANTVFADLERLRTLQITAL